MSKKCSPHPSGPKNSGFAKEGSTSDLNRATMPLRPHGRPPADVPSGGFDTVRRAASSTTMSAGSPVVLSVALARLFYSATGNGEDTPICEVSRSMSVDLISGPRPEVGASPQARRTPTMCLAEEDAFAGTGPLQSPRRQIGIGPRSRSRG